MKTLKVCAMSAFVLAFTLVGCGKEETPAPAPSSATAATPETMNLARRAKDEAVQKMQADYDKMQASLDALQAKVDQGGDQAKADFAKAKEDLTAKMNAFKSKLDEAKSASTDEWNKMKPEMDISWSQLKDACQKLADTQTTNEAAAAGTKAREEAVGKMQVEYDKMKDSLKDFQAKADQQGDQAKADYAKMKDDLTLKMDQFKVQLDKAKSASAADWDKMKTDLDNAWSDLQDTYKKIADKFSAPAQT